MKPLAEIVAVMHGDYLTGRDSSTRAADSIQTLFQP